MYRYRRISAWVVIPLAWAVAYCGCGDHGAKETLAAARQSVQIGLDAWQRGEAAASLMNGSSPIEFADDDWNRAARLVEYDVVKTYMETDGTPRCAVSLVLRHGDKSPEPMQVTYQVVTKEQRTVIARDPFS